jgi:hypothetical protein
LVRFLAQNPGAPPEKHDKRTDEVIGRINRHSRELWPTGFMRTLGTVLASVECGTVTITCRFDGGLTRSGEAMSGGVTWNGRRAMRVSVVNWRTTTADVDRTVAAVARAIADAV